MHPLWSSDSGGLRLGDADTAVTLSMSQGPRRGEWRNGATADRMDTWNPVL
jgi:hypothetical protein